MKCLVAESEVYQERGGWESQHSGGRNCLLSSFALL